jgi:hypothetical protein
VAASKTLTPEQRRERARKAGAASHSLDRFVNAIVNRAPELTPEQIAKLRPILADGRA